MLLGQLSKSGDQNTTQGTNIDITEEDSM